MRYSFAPLALAAVAAAVPQGVTQAITPPTSAPAGCTGDYPGTFQIQVVNVTSSSKVKRQENASGALMLTLQGGVLKDAQGRIGYIAANNQFQFDGPPQTGAIYTAGWSVCQNKTLALGSDVEFKQCLSGTFYNLYDENNAPQCTPVYIEAINGNNGGAAASVQADGQPTASPQPVNQIGDGQPQASTGAVTQIGDGQIQAPTGAPVNQIGDGQIQAPTTTPAAAPVTQIGDGQIQAPTGAPVSQIGDGQIQAPTNATRPAQPTVQPYTGAASSMRSELFGLAAGVLAVAML